MLRRIAVSALFVVVCFALAPAAQRQVLKIVPDAGASAIKSAGAEVRVEWVQLKGVGSQVPPEAQPAEGDIYYASAPAGGDLSKYRKVSSVVGVGNELVAFGGAGARKRVTRFIPNRQGGLMGPGVYVAIVASVVGEDTLYSDYFGIMVASAEPPALVYPRANVLGNELAKQVSELAPLFQWKPVPGVPYYHVVLADAPFTDREGRPNAKVNIIWQAITPNTRIAYGAPDPSNTVTASPPPLATGKTYSWMVLNNYGNHTAFTSWDVISVLDQVAGRFEIRAAEKLNDPRAVAPANGRTFNNDARIEFKWANLDPGANSYLLNLFRAGSTADFGMADLGSFSMNLLVWEAAVPRGTADTLSALLDAAGTLMGGRYMWRVYALDSRGAASTGDVISTSEFTYNKSGEGFLSIETSESVGGERLPVGFVELKSEVLEGPKMAPLLFYTDKGGTLSNRRFSAGTYRITAIKEGYYTQTSTVTVEPGGTARVTIPMSRPEAVLYGKALAALDKSAVSMATVAAVSEWGDTLSVATDGSGGFMLACKAGDWVVTVAKPGFAASSPMKVSIPVGHNRDMGSILLERNPFVLSGVVRNPQGGQVVAARVRVLREGALVDELASTPQSGVYAFNLAPGTYTLTAEKAGFTMFSRSVTVTGTASQDITLKDGAALVNGSIVGRSWVSSKNSGTGGYVDAPITSARVTFVETGAAVPDTFIVISDPVFGRFSINLPHGKTYDVKVAAAGFGSEAAIRGLATGAADAAGAPITYADTIYALATINGLVARVVGSDAVFMGGVDVLVYDAGNRVVASTKSMADGRYEIRNIPSGRVTVVAGADGYYTETSTPVYPLNIDISNGRLTPNSDSYNIRLRPGDKTVRWNVSGYAGGGAVKVMLPLNKTLPFDNAAGGVTAELSGAGAGVYVIEAASDAGDTSLLELSHHRFNVPSNASVYTDTIYFPYEYSAPNEITVDSSGKYEVRGPTTLGNPPHKAVKMRLYYRSEGSVRFDSTDIDVPAGRPLFRITPTRDGCYLYYYFRVFMENDDVYGSSKQFYRTFVKPDAAVISRIAVEPGASSGDTLFMPSAYSAVFAFRAFYSTQFTPLSDNAGTVSWDIVNAENGERLNRANAVGASYTYTTPSNELDIFLRATFTPTSAYTMKSGVPKVVEFPIRVTGKSLKSLNIVRKGEGGSASNTEQIGFKVEALDGEGKPVTVSPRWSVTPRSAGTISTDGLFTPSGSFFGTAGITATAGGLSEDYTEPGAEAPGQSIYYALRHNATKGDTANTLKGMRIAFVPGAVREGMTALFEVAVPELKNHVYRGTDELKMADSVAIDLSCGNVDAMTGAVTLIFDIPEHLRSAAKNGSQEFKVARWFPDSLKWIPLDDAYTSYVDGHTAVSAVLLHPSEAGALPKKSLKKAQGLSRASLLSASARYALVTKTSGTSLHVIVSPHPFSPYILPRKEYGNSARPGTCIRVNVEAGDPYVESIKVHIYNATGKMVWAVTRPGAPTGQENRFWWNGRTSGHASGRSSVSEEMYPEGHDIDRNADRPMCRNGRYFVRVTVTDMEGRQRRAVKPIVLMK